jgi:hypothetical protein
VLKKPSLVTAMLLGSALAGAVLARVAYARQWACEICAVVFGVAFMAIHGPIVALMLATETEQYGAGGMTIVFMGGLVTAACLGYVFGLRAPDVDFCVTDAPASRGEPALPLPPEAEGLPGFAAPRAAAGDAPAEAAAQAPGGEAPGAEPPDPDRDMWERLPPAAREQFEREIARREGTDAAGALRRRRRRKKFAYGGAAVLAATSLPLIVLACDLLTALITAAVLAGAGAGLGVLAYVRRWSPVASAAAFGTAFMAVSMATGLAALLLAAQGAAFFFGTFMLVVCFAYLLAMRAGDDLGS